MLDICFLLSFLTLLLSGIASTVWNLTIHIKRLSKPPVFNPISVFSIFTFLAFLILFIPNAFLKYERNIFISLLSALFDTMDSLSFGNSISDMLKRFFEHFDEVPYIYVFYACFVTLMVPVFTMRAVFLIFRDVFTQIRYKINRKNVFHIFSELNNKSLTIANDIIKKDKNAKIIFTSVSKKTTDNLYIEQARKINALLTDKTINGFRLQHIFPNKKLYLYFITKNRNDNITLALDKFEELKNFKTETTIYVFSTEYADEKIIDIANSRANNPKIKAELFNAAQRIAYNLMYEHPLYEVGTDSKDINIMIIGAGHIGLEIAKAAAWCSQMTSRSFSVKIFDKDRKSEKSTFPFNGLSEKLSKIGTSLNLEFFECDIFSDKFDSLRFERADYITIDIGDDSANLAAALQMRESYARQKNNGAYIPADAPSPKIITIIKDEETKKIVETLNDSAIIPYGTMCDVFNLDNIVNWKIEKIGRFLHASYECFNHIINNTDEDIDCHELFNQALNSYSSQSELNKRSSRASGIHSKYKFADIGIDTKSSNLFSEDSEWLFKRTNESMLNCEHNRWNAFQMLDGWESWDKNSLSKGKHKDEQAKLHAYLAKFDELKAIAQYIYGENKNPIKYDQVMVCASRFAVDYAENGYPDKEKLEQLFMLLKEYAKENINEKILS